MSKSQPDPRQLPKLTAKDHCRHENTREKRQAHLLSSIIRDRDSGRTKERRKDTHKRVIKTSGIRGPRLEFEFAVVACQDASESEEGLSETGRIRFNQERMEEYGGCTSK